MMKFLIMTCFTLSLNHVAAKDKWAPAYKKKNQKNQTSKKIMKKKSNLSPEGEKLVTAYKKTYKSKKDLKALKKKTLKLSGKAIPSLVQVVKSEEFPDKNRWMAMFLIGRIIGKKSSPFISKFLKHPSWVLRLASLKTLLALKADKFGAHYSLLLKDKSLLVRSQAMDNIRQLGLKQYAPLVWKTLFDKNNYTKTKEGSKRTFIISKAIKAVGDLEFNKVQRPLLKMIQKNKYEGLFTDIEYSLEKMTGKKSPKGNVSVKRHFWKRLAVKNEVI